MKKNIKRFLFLTTATIGGMYIYNKIVESTSTSKKLTSDDKGSYYNWKQGNIYYTKKGFGSPLLLIHNLNPSDSSYEWSKVEKKLEKNHTVYTLDLLGCGLSDKPALTYTNYLYVQLITSFVKDIIKNKTDVIASGFSSSFVLMANQLDKELFDHIIFVNPILNPNNTNQITVKEKLILNTIQLPIIGTFIYNIMHTPRRIDANFRKNIFSKPQLLSFRTEDTYYETSHLDHSNGKYLFGSILSNFMNIEDKYALSKLDKTIYVISSKELIRSNNNIIHNEYIDYTFLTDCKLYPHLEIPERFLSTIKTILC